VQINPEEIKAIFELWKKKWPEQTTVREVRSNVSRRGKDLGDISFEGVTATGWVGDFLADLEGRRPLQNCQRQRVSMGRCAPIRCVGYSWLSFLRRWDLGACLADDMGLGKTVQTLALLQRYWGQEISVRSS